MPTQVVPIAPAAAPAPPAPVEQLVTRPVEAPGELAARPVDVPGGLAAQQVEKPSQLAARPVDVPGELATRPVEVAAPRPRLTPLAPGRFALQVTISQETYDLLRYAQELLGHQVPTGDVAQVLERGLVKLVHDLEKQKFGATDKPRSGGKGTSSRNPRHIPAAVRHAVWKRDGSQCAFVSDDGHRCTSRTPLEFDHMIPVARGGKATVDTIRLLCRAHNQYAADQEYGSGFMERKREMARNAKLLDGGGATTARAQPCAATGSAVIRP